MKQAFGSKIPPLLRPSARRINLLDPRVVACFYRNYAAMLERNNLCQRIFHIQDQCAHNTELTLENEIEYEKIDALRMMSIRYAEK